MDNQTSLHNVLDDHATATIVAEPADFSEFGPVERAAFRPDNAVANLANYLAASTSGVALNLSDATGNQVGQQVLKASVEKRGRGRGARVTGMGVIDPIMLAYMTVAEYYSLVEGDLWQMALTALQMGFHSELRWSGDEAKIKEASDRLDAMNIDAKVGESWLARYIYGNAYPAFLREGTEITDVININPKHIAIQPQVGLGPRRTAYAPPASTIEAISQLAQTPSFIYKPITAEWNEPLQGQVTVGLEVNPGDIMHLHTPKLPNHIYAIPPFARAMQAIDSRRDLDDMSQITIKGFKSQLWLFLLENPKRGEAAALRAALSGNARTGVLVWAKNLAVEQHAPKSLDDLLGNETYWRYTMAVYRTLGITPRVISGESPNIRAASGDSETDIEVYLDRLMYDRKPFERLIQTVVNSWYAPGQAPVCQLPDIELKIASRIKNILVPVMNFGLPSPTTAFQMAGLNPLTEMQQHEKDMDWREKNLFPYTGFAQSGPDGIAQSPQSQGRPQGAGDKKPRQTSSASQEVTAAIDTAYANRVAAIWRDLVDSPDETHVKAFVMGLVAAAAEFRRPAYVKGYTENGGNIQPDEARIQAVVAFDASNLARFEQALLASVAVPGADLSNMTGRAMLYAQMGYRQAYVSGALQARAEMGFDGWQRVLGPSNEGPCPACIADAGTVHHITEPFTDHPHGACRLQIIRMFRRNLPGALVRLPTIREAFNVW